MFRFRFLFLLLMALQAGQISAEKPLGRGFIPNAGQWPEQIRFKTDVPSGQLYLSENSFIWNFYNTEALHRHHGGNPHNEPLDFIQGQVVSMSFQGSQTPSAMIKDAPGTVKFNYFLGNKPSQWASGLLSYESVKYKELYPKTDLQIQHNPQGIKYSFLLEPGANPAQIAIRYDGADMLRLVDGRLEIQTRIITFAESAPIAWQTDKGRKIPVECAFRLNGNTLTFQLGEYNSGLPLVIDPQFIFSTYSGSTADNWGYTATFDDAGNGYSGGIVFGTGFPVTPGVYQASFGGGDAGLVAGFDIGILKYNPLGTDLLYATYLGGSGNEFPHSIVVNDQNELLVFGLTSSANYPVGENAYSKQFKGGPSVMVLDGELKCSAGTDMFITRFSYDGSQILAGTFIGGSNTDGANLATNLDYNYGDVSRGAINVDHQNNIVVVSSTSSEDLPITANAIQSTYGGGAQDGLIMKFDQSLSQLLWSSYLGGSGDDGIYGLAFGPTDEMVITGGTTSSNFPVTGGVVSESFGGGSADAFVSVIHPQNFTLMASSYWGTSSYDQAYLVDTDKSGNIFLFGQTGAGGNYFIRNAGFFNTGGNQFISKFKPDLSDVVWSTAFGNANGVPDLVPCALQVDVCNKVYISGWGGTTNSVPGTTIGLQTTPDAVRQVSDGSDFYLMVMDDQAQNLLYGTFLGVNGVFYVGDHVDGGTSRFDPRGVIYQSVCAGCGGNDKFPTTPGAWSNTNNSSNCNEALMKFDFEYPITIAAFAYEPPPVSCSPASVVFTNYSTNAQSYQWFIDGEPMGTEKDLLHTFQEAGNYKITLIAVNQTSCNISDTSSRNLVVSTPDVLVADILSEKFGTCDGVDVLLNGSGSEELKWLLPGGQESEKASTTLKIPFSDTVQIQLVVFDGICRDTATATEVSKGLYDYYKQNDANVFSPNNDGINDCFSPALQIQPKPYDKAFLECSELYVYNRWGELVYDGPKSLGEGCWDGKSSAGNALPEGVYFYRFIFDGREYAGTVHLRLN